MGVNETAAPGGDPREPAKAGGGEEDVRHTPVDIGQSGPTTLRIRWADGHESLYPVAHLRRNCPCASCVDEWTGRRLLDPGEVSDEVRPVSVRRVGRYAIGFVWSDGHSTGIYTFEHLRTIDPGLGLSEGELPEEA